ncbi:hypothetical protein [Nonomuraea jiangxiensis]|uniref:Uncharacterized protein n=1 Tax=Nonomuraea jiangxiensis TaxID=633440 RepID=A0A1G8QLY1_9ACTN|nr:hypothetical protein [Nonomuraea jiangxiensis]SDJ05375.1 hypothetical protein SAMN05421869_108282 [Nonomuraea jiangxiensis]
MAPPLGRSGWNIAPLARTVWPETQSAESPISLPTTGAMSPGTPSRPRGLWWVAAWMDSGVSADR